MRRHSVIFLSKQHNTAARLASFDCIGSVTMIGSFVDPELIQHLLGALVLIAQCYAVFPNFPLGLMSSTEAYPQAVRAAARKRKSAASRAVRVFMSKSATDTGLVTCSALGAGGGAARTGAASLLKHNRQMLAAAAPSTL